MAGALRGAPHDVTLERSGVAYAAGFAGVFHLLFQPLAPAALSAAAGASGLAACLVLALTLPAALALLLSFAAGATLDGSSGKSGALPALFGFAVGWLGVVKGAYFLALWLRM